MTTHAPVTDRILGAVKHSHGCDLDTLAESVPELTWNQVFLEIDRLSRQGEILVTCDTGGRYMIQLPEHKKGPKTHHAQP
jgi:predicted  nucleic acid-binding Zn-ribbon protein